MTERKPLESIRPPMESRPDLDGVVDREKLLLAWVAMTEALTGLTDVTARHEVDNVRTREDNARTRRVAIVSCVFVALVAVVVTVLGERAVVMVVDHCDQVVAGAVPR